MCKLLSKSINGTECIVLKTDCLVVHTLTDSFMLRYRLVLLQRKAACVGGLTLHLAFTSLHQAKVQAGGGHCQVWRQ